MNNIDSYGVLFRLFRFDMPAPTITPELKKDLEVLQVWSNFLTDNLISRGSTT
jgi:hypothetical protein